MTYSYDVVRARMESGKVRSAYLAITFSLASVLLLSACAVTPDRLDPPGTPDPAIAPVDSTCGGVQVDEECTATISLLNAQDGYAGLEFRIAGPGLAVVRSQSLVSSSSGDCLSQAGPSKVILVCSAPMAGSGRIASIVFRRTAPEPTTVSVTEAYVAPDSRLPLERVGGGSLFVEGSG